MRMAPDGVGDGRISAVWPHLQMHPSTYGIQDNSQRLCSVMDGMVPPDGTMRALLQLCKFAGTGTSEDCERLSCLHCCP